MVDVRLGSVTKARPFLLPERLGLSTARYQIESIHWYEWGGQVCILCAVRCLFEQVKSGKRLTSGTGSLQ